MRSLHHKLSLIFCVSCLSLLSACGGGGGGGGGDSFAGLWDMNLVEMENECGFASENMFGVIATVNDDGTNITVDILATGATLKGARTAEGDGEGFVASATNLAGPLCPDGSISHKRLALTFSDMEDEDKAKGVSLTASFDCGYFSCNVYWSGSAERQ